jgi:hypothetical protein
MKTFKEKMDDYKTKDFKVLSGEWNANIGTKKKEKIVTTYFIEVKDNSYIDVVDLDFDKQAILDWIAKEKSGRGRTILMARRYIDFYCKNVKVVKIIK